MKTSYFTYIFRNGPVPNDFDFFVIKFYPFRTNYKPKENNFMYTKNVFFLIDI